LKVVTGRPNVEVGRWRGRFPTSQLLDWFARNKTVAVTNLVDLGVRNSRGVILVWSDVGELAAET